MKELEKPDQEPEIKEKLVKDTKPSKPFSKVRREVTEEELMTNSTALRLILGQLDQAELRVGELSEYQEKSHKADIKVAVLEEQLKTSRAIEVMFAICLTFGSLLIGLTPSYGLYAFLTGAVLFIVGVA